MGKFNFDFNKSIVSIKGKNIYIDIRDDEKNKRFTSEFLSSLQKKYSQYNFHINKLKNIILTKNKDYKIYRNNKLSVGMEIESIGRITNVNEIQQNNMFYYDITIENINDSSALKLYGVFSEKVIFLSKNKYITFKGKVSEVNKKEYEKQLKFNKYVIKIKEIAEIQKEDIKSISKRTGDLRRPLCVSSSLSNGFIDDCKIQKRDNEISGYCITDLNTLNFVENHNMDIPLGIKAYIKIDKKFYSIYLYINSRDSYITFNGEKIRVNEGIRKLNEMISNIKTTYNGGYVFDINDILENKDKFKVGSMDHDGIVYQALIDGDFNFLEKYIELFDVLAIEPMDMLSQLCNEGRKNSSYENLKKVNELIRRLGEKYAIPIVFNGNPVVMSADDREYAREFIISNAIKEEGIKNKEEYVEQQRKKIKLDSIGYIRSTPEIVDELTEQGFELRDIEQIVFEGLLFQSLLPKKKEITIIPNYLFVEDNKEEKDKLIKIVKSQFADFTDKELTKKELSMIFKKNYQKVFLAAYTVSKISRELGYPIGERGTAGCMYLCYLLLITNFNPKEFGLDRRMFLGPNLEKVPDIDINVSSTIIKQVMEDFNKYFPNTMKASICSYFKENSVKSQILLKTNPDLDIYYACNIMNGKLARIQPHNSGIMLLPNIDTNYIFPTIKYNEDKIPGYPYEYLEKAIPKIDILSKNDLDILKDINNYRKLEHFQTKEDYNTNSEDIYELINKNSNNISELNTDYAKKIIELIKPKSFDDLIIIQGLLHGRGVLNSAQRCIGHNLKIIACREDLIDILNSYKIDNSFDIMEKIRKGKYEQLTSEERADISKLPEEYQKALGQIQYLFPKSHAIAYAKQAYFSAYYELNKDKILKNKKEDIYDEYALDDLEEFLEEE